MKRVVVFALAFFVAVSYAENQCCSYPCQNNGVCLTEGFDGYSCDCTGTGFYGRNCESTSILNSIKLWLRPTKATQYDLLLGYQWFWDIVHSITSLHDFFTTRLYISRSSVIDAPPLYENEHSYLTLDAYHNRSVYVRTLPPVPEGCPTPMGVAGKKKLPSIKLLSQKFLPRDTFKPDQTGLSLLFPYFAQHFTHMYLKTDVKKGPQHYWGGHGIDVSHVYGKDKDVEDMLRSFKDGKLKSQFIKGREWPVLRSKGTNTEVDYLVAMKPENDYALAHPFFGNVPGIFMFATIWLREHNRVCDVMKKVHPEWDDERLYQTGKVIILGEMIKIIIEDYVQELSNFNLKIKWKPELLFDHKFSYDYRMNLEFNHLYHWHQLVPDTVNIQHTNYTVRSTIGRPDLVVKYGIAKFVEAASKQNAGSFTVNNLPKYLRHIPEEVIKYGRQLRLQPYNNYRKRFNLPPRKSFEDLTGEKIIAKQLEDMYGDVDAVEFYVGLLTERKGQRAVFGDTMQEMGASFSVRGLMSNPICSPKYWKPSTFGGDVGFDMVKTASITKLFCQNLKEDCPEVSFKVRNRQGSDVHGGEL